MRVISGIYKHRRFDVPRTFKARPTTDFAKENLFNVLANRIDFDGTDALDLFSGTGSISIELLSRGCRRVVSVESDPEHSAFISKVMQTVRAEGSIIIKGDVFKYLARCQEQFDFIFADPPYQLPELGTLPDVVLNSSILKPGGIFVLEHGEKYYFKEHPRFREMRVYGSVHFSFFE